jgi:hypothetical protein
MSVPVQGKAPPSDSLSVPSRPSAPSQRPVPKYKGFCEIAISPFDSSHSAHANDADKRSQKHDVIKLPSPSHVSDAGWIRQNTSVRLSSGCTVIMERDDASNVDLMHMLQVGFNLTFGRPISNSPTHPHLPSPLHFSGVRAETRAPIFCSLNSYLLPSTTAHHLFSGTRSSAALIPSRHALSFLRRRSLPRK